MIAGRFSFFLFHYPHWSQPQHQDAAGQTRSGRSIAIHLPLRGIKVDNAMLGCENEAKLYCTSAVGYLLSNFLKHNKGDAYEMSSL